MTASPMRLDAFLLARGDFDSRSQAQAAIKAGRVRINGVTALKPSTGVTSQDVVQTDGPAHPWVSRGGVKLAAGLDHFGIDPSRRVCLDLGASTGGFTDVLLARGAAKVYAVDVGRDQLHAKLRGDARVVSLESVHAREVSASLVPEPVALVVCDVSFISLKKALPAALALAGPGACLLALVKPQFELGRERIGKGGIVKGDPEDAPRDLAEWLGARPGWRVDGHIPSPIRGGDGNAEFLLHGRLIAARGGP